jgi:phosphoesterase RecJ-like protein
MTVPEGEWDRAVAVLEGARAIALTCHVDPDGDALGSMLALERVLRLRGVETSAAWGNEAPLPSRFAFMPGVERLTTLEAFPTQPAVLVVLDCASVERLGKLRGTADAAGCVIVLDHHASGMPFGDIRLVDDQAAATAVLVERLIQRMGGRVDREVATCLYVGLVTDTGRFGYASTTPEVMELGARLIACSIDHAAINRRIWGSHSFGYVKMLGRAMERAQLVQDVGLAWTAVEQRDLTELGITMEEAEGVVEVLRGVDSLECTCLCKEQPSADGQLLWKVSLRSRGEVDVGRIAMQWGGGGHAAAAGFTATGTLEDIVASVIERLPARSPRGASVTDD